MNNLAEEIARYFNHGWNDEEIASALAECAEGDFEFQVALVGAIRDLMTERTEK